MTKLDLNRGLETRFDASTGVAVSMYLDQPGVYLSDHGTPLPETYARKVGFPVDEYGREKRKRDLQKQAIDKIEAQFTPGGTAEVRAESDGFKLVHVGHGYFNVVDAATDVALNPRPLIEPNAKALFKDFAPSWVEEPVAAPEKPAKTFPEGVKKSATAG